MTRAEAVEEIVDGQTPLTYQAHLLSAWEFALRYHHEPSIEELRAYLSSGQCLSRNFWQQGLEARSHERTQPR